MDETCSTHGKHLERIKPSEVKGTGFRFPTVLRNYSLLHSIQTGHRAHPADNRGSLSSDKLKFNMGDKVAPMLN
jgi:hypothetical protein